MKTRTLHKLATRLTALVAVTSEAKASPPLLLAQATQSLKTSVQTALGVVFIFGFIWGVIKIWGGADRMSKGDADGKMGIVSGIIIAGAAAIMAVLFTIFGMSDGALTPSF
jgi:fumarate reductase subunit D